MPLPNPAHLASPRQTAALARRLAPRLAAPLRVYLSGELGAGKTFFVRALLAALGERGNVRSPSYALVYNYQLGALVVHHLDCYRLQGAAVGDDLLELIGEDALILLEWHEHASGLPPADLYLRFEFCPSSGDNARTLYSHAASSKAAGLLAAL